MIDEKKLLERLEAIEEHCLDMHDWQGQSAIVEAKEIVNQLAEEDKTCYKSCTECEAYDKEKHYCPKFCEVLKEAAKELAEEFNNGWIPCSERLPEESLNSVLGWDEYRERCCFAQYYGGRWHIGNDIESVKILAWQPLPAPFQSKGE